MAGFGERQRQPGVRRADAAVLEQAVELGGDEADAAFSVRRRRGMQDSGRSGALTEGRRLCKGRRRNGGDRFRKTSARALPPATAEMRQSTLSRCVEALKKSGYPDRGAVNFLDP